MRRKATLLSLLMIIAVVIIITLIPREHSYFLNEITVSNDEWRAIKDSRVQNDLLNVDDIEFDGHKLQRDADGKRYFYSLLEGSDNAKTPTITVPRGNNISVVSKASAISNDDIANNWQIKIMLYTGLSYREINIIATTLPTLNIDTKGHPEITEDKSEARIELFDNRADAKQHLVTSDAEIHLRGSTSLIQKKKSFKVDLRDGKKNNNVDLLGMRKDDDWVLNSLYGDHEKVRNILSAQMWRDCCTEHNEFEAENSFEYRYVEVFIDNSYQGLYLLGYKPDKKTADLGANEYTFKNRDWSNADVLEQDDNFARYYELDSEYSDEEAAEEELHKFISILADGSKKDIYNSFDITNAVDIELHAQITAETDYVKDGKTKNLYMNIKDTANGRKMLYTPWDFDLSFGNTWVDGTKNNTSTESYGLNPTELVESAATPVASLVAKKDKTIQETLKKRYAKLRKGAWSDEHIFALIGEYEVELFASGAYYRDQARWPKGNYIEDAKDLSLLKKFVRKRLKFLDEYYNYSK